MDVLASKVFFHIADADEFIYWVIGGCIDFAAVAVGALLLTWIL